MDSIRYQFACRMMMRQKLMELDYEDYYEDDSGEDDV